LTITAGIPVLVAASGRLVERASGGKIPVGLELYSVREQLKRDAEGTVRAVAKMGYQCVEFYAPYFDWTEAQTKQMRKELGRKYQDARETLDDWKDDAKEVAEDALERGQELADELRDRVAPLAAAMKRR